MSVSIRPLHPLFVGEVAGIDCHQPLGADEVAAIEAGMDRRRPQKAENRSRSCRQL